MGESKNGFVISDLSDHGASKEPTNLVRNGSIYLSLSGFVGSFDAP